MVNYAEDTNWKPIKKVINLKTEEKFKLVLSEKDIFYPNLFITPEHETFIMYAKHNMSTDSNQIIDFLVTKEMIDKYLSFTKGPELEQIVKEEKIFSPICHDLSGYEYCGYDYIDNLLYLVLFKKQIKYKSTS